MHTIVVLVVFVIAGTVLVMASSTPSERLARLISAR